LATSVVSTQPKPCSSMPQPEASAPLPFNWQKRQGHMF
jgi:hypothetical protein